MFRSRSVSSHSTSLMISAFIFIFAVVVFCGGVFSLWRLLFAKNKPTEPSALAMIGSHTYRVEVAKTLEQKAKGLAGRSLLPAGQGMLFPFKRRIKPAFTTQGMLFPLDIIWIADGKIADIADNVKPDTGMLATPYRPALPVDTVLELHGGVVARDGLKIGDSVTLSYKK